MFAVKKTQVRYDRSEYDPIQPPILKYCFHHQNILKLYISPKPGWFDIVNQPICYGTLSICRSNNSLIQVLLKIDVYFTLCLGS